LAAHATRLIEDYLPIAAINEVAQREKIGHADTHPRKLHLWWARRPLAAARAAVYSALVPAEGRGRTPEEEAAFFNALCRWGANPLTTDQARGEVLAANAGVPPKVLDLFAGGGAIPLEAARLGCDATAIELNPVAHLIERCMLEYPQAFPELADDIRKWGKIWVDQAWDQLRDMYPPVPGTGSGQQRLGTSEHQGRRPLAYLWTRTVPCPNPALPEHRVPLVRQTWLVRRGGRNVALRTVVDKHNLTVTYKVVEAGTPAGLDFDPASGSKRGEATCPICGATVSADYAKQEGKAGRMGVAPLAAVVLKASGRGRDYLAPGEYQLPDDEECLRRLDKLDIEPPSEAITADDARNFWTPLYGLTRFRDLFTPRQLLTLCTLAVSVRNIHDEMLATGVDANRAKAISTYLGLAIDRVTDVGSSLCHWHNTREQTENTYARQALPMVWDFSEVNFFAGARGDIADYVVNNAEIVRTLSGVVGARVLRTSATSVPLADASQDAVITDPPYYDNISYADLSDFFYVWLKRSIGWLYPDDFGGELTPKRNEAVVAPYRHKGSKVEARQFYERLMADSFAEAHRVLKPGAPLVCIYAHKTTLGWSTLVDALRTAGFTITEAWPLDTEMPERSGGQGTASLASSIFLVARKRDGSAGVGSERKVLSELDGIIHERLDRLQAAGVTGSDLVIATVGAGLRPFTRYEAVEQDNGEPLPAERFLALVQGKVLDAIFGGLAGADTATRFYVAAQFSYGYAAVDFAEANNLAHMTGVELDGPRGLTAGHGALVAKAGSTVRLRDFEERGEDHDLGKRGDLASAPPPIIDVAQGVLWRAEHRPSELTAYLDDARPDNDLLRNVVQALAGKALRSGGADLKPPEAAAAERLLGAWRRLVDDNLLRQQ
jgi:putative DNA methylase